VLQTYSIVQIKDLKNDIQRSKNAMVNLEDQVAGDIRNIYSNVDRKLTEYTSLVSSCGYEIGLFNLDTLTVPITFTMQPKTLTDNTKIYLDFEGKKQELQRRGSQFSLTKDCTVEYQIHPTIVIEENGTQQFEQHPDLSVNDLVEQVFSHVNMRFSGESGCSGQDPYNYTMNGHINLQQYFTGANDYFKDGQYVVTLDGKELKSYEVTDFEHFNLEINDKFQMEKGQKLVGKFVATDKKDILYEQMIFMYIAGLDNGEQMPEPYFEQLSITAPDGRLIYKFDERNYEEIYK
ncbi:MAG: hypothetical protein RR355_02810, partial [Oscillospiraceae bacterium]